MSLMLKDPAAALDYEMDWGREYLGGELLRASAWTVTPSEAGGLTILTDGHDLVTTRVKVEGGIAGHVYRLTNHVETESARSDSRSLLVRVEAR